MIATYFLLFIGRDCWVGCARSLALYLVQFYHFLFSLQVFVSVAFDVISEGFDMEMGQRLRLYDVLLINSNTFLLLVIHAHCAVIHGGLSGHRHRELLLAQLQDVILCV